jgi:hypothetical protein
VLGPTSSGSDPLQPIHDARLLPSRSAAAQRRAMQGALANAVRAMRSTGGRRGSMPGSRHTPPSTGT